MAHRSLNGRPLQHLPAIADIARDDHDLVVIQKSAQVGVSELLVSKALWAADTGYAERGNVLFLMPTQNQMDDFAQGRFDRALQDNAYFRSRLQPEPPRRKGADSKRLKHLGPGYIYLRGADGRRQIASVDADLVILDEFDQMAAGTLELARKRLSSSGGGRLVVASTPRLPEAGINALYLQSDQRRYFLTCRDCGLEQALDWPDNVDFERPAIVCRQCRKPLDVLEKGRWLARAPGNERIHGYHFSQLYSPWVNLSALIEASREATPAAIQEFQNSDLGEAFVPPGGQLSVDTIDRCRREYGLEDYAGQKCNMGVDVGIVLHVVIRERGEGRSEAKDCPQRLWFAGEVGWNELDGLMERFNVQQCVIDALPETYQASNFVLRYPDRAALAQYDRHLGPHELEPGTWDHPPRYHVNRLQVLDAAIDRFQRELNLLPKDARTLGNRTRDGLGDFYRQLLTPKRSLEQDAQGNWVARWTDNSKADHYFHAEAYCRLANDIVPWRWIAI
jgi:Phage terminase large subunit gpA, ATPase domain